MSNESNERANDTAAQAFQVGDRVRFKGTPGVRGVIAPPKDHVEPGWVYVSLDHDMSTDPQVGYFLASDLEPVPVVKPTPPPTPASAPAQTVDPIRAMEAAMPAALGATWHEWSEACYRENVPPAVALITLVHHAAKRGANAAVDAMAPASEPATPAPAATAPALELPVDIAGQDGTAWLTNNILRLSGEAVDRLAAALAARLR